MDAAVELGILDPDYKTFFCEDFMHKGLCTMSPAAHTHAKVYFGNCHDKWVV